MIRTPFNWFNKFGTLPATYKEAMSYEEQIMWLMKEVQRNESYADEFQAEIDTINESVSKLNTDIDDVYVNLNRLFDEKQNVLTAGNGIMIKDDKVMTAPTSISHLFIANGYIDFTNASVTDVLDLTPLIVANTNYLILDVTQGETIELIGKMDLAILNEQNEIVVLEKNIETSSFDNPAKIDILEANRKLVVSFYETNINVPDGRIFMSSDYIYDQINAKQEKLIAGNGITLNGNVISSDGSADTYINISSLLKQNQYIELTNKSVGDTVDLTPVSAMNTAYYIKEVALSEQFKITGNYIIAEIDNENKIVNKISGTATIQNPYVYTCIANLPSRARIVISFENTNSNAPTVYDNISIYYLFNNIENGKRISKLKGDIYLDNGFNNSTLLDGLYFTGDKHVYINNVIDTKFDNALILAMGNDILYVIISPANNHSNLAYYEAYYDYSSNTWKTGSFDISTSWNLIADKPAGIENYSTSEQVIGTWIDGKPLYQKVITGTFPEITDGIESKATFSIAENIDMIYIKNAWFLRGNSPFFKEMLPYNDVNFNYAQARIGNTAFTLNQNQLTIVATTVQASEKTFYAVVNYTKTTD